MLKYRVLGRTGYEISEISFGAWAIGGSWGTVDDSESLDALRRAIELGINFIDTADVYGDGRSETLIAKVLADFPHDKIYVATKAGRRLDPHAADGYTAKNLRAFVERSLTNLGAETLDLLQLHCPPTDVYYTPTVFEALDGLVKAGKIRHYGVSVEKVEEGLKAIEYPNLASVQIIFNMFRQRPMEHFLSESQKRQVGVITRVPLASGLLTGKLNRDSVFADDDHRSFNRAGQAFDRGETFAGVDFERGLKAVDELKRLVPSGFSLTQMALRWILQFPEVSCAIPGAKRRSQVEDNVRASDMPKLSPEAMQTVYEIYDEYVRSDVHHRW